MSDVPHRFGHVALLGRPNVGKSSLQNRLLGVRLAITAPRPQTTRQNLLGILSIEGGQIGLLDTPGLHREQFARINQSMNRAAIQALGQSDLALLVVEAGQFDEKDRFVLRHAQQAGVPVAVVVNKVDTIQPREALLPFLDALASEGTFQRVWLVSAKTGSGIARLQRELLELLPEGPPGYGEDELTDRPMRFLAAERVREQIMRKIDREVPYACAVEIERYAEEERRVEIHAIIWVEREGQKGILIGEGGQMLKSIGMRARQEIARLIERPVHLELWVKVKASWSNDERQLRRFGYD